MGRFTKIENRLVWQFDTEKLWIEAWGKDGLRVRCTKNSQMNHEPWALLEFDAEAQITISEKYAVIKNGKIQARILDDGEVSFYNHQGKLLLKEYSRMEDSDGESRSLLKIAAREFKPGRGEDFGLTVRFESDRYERLYGMGQYQQEELNLKGCLLELAQRNSQASVPFCLSDKGYGFLWNNPAIGQVVFGTNRTEWQAQSTKQMDYWVTAGDTPQDIMQNYMEVTGKPPMMPEYAMGFWQCKLRYKTQDELMQVAREYYERKIPLSVIVIDYFHWPNQGVWDFDRKYWQNPEKWLKNLKKWVSSLWFRYGRP